MHDVQPDETLIKPRIPHRTETEKVQTKGINAENTKTKRNHKFTVKVSCANSSGYLVVIILQRLCIAFRVTPLHCTHPSGRCVGRLTFWHSGFGLSPGAGNCSFPRRDDVQVSWRAKRTDRAFKSPGHYSTGTSARDDCLSL